MNAVINAVGASVQVTSWTASNRFACEACGIHIGGWERFRGWWKALSLSVANYSYCAGGKELSEPVVGIERALSGRSERTHDCAGVTEPHLHVTCKFCGKCILMRVKGEPRP